MWQMHKVIVAVMEIFATTGYDAEPHAFLDEMASTKRMGFTGSWRSDRCYSTKSLDLDPECTNFRNEHARTACFVIFVPLGLISESLERTWPFLPDCMSILASLN